VGEKINIIEDAFPSFPEWSYFHSVKSTLEIYDEILSSLSGAGSVFLDSGCGKKSMMQRHNPKLKLSIGMDISIDAMKENQAFKVYVVGDASKLQFRDSSFNAVVSQWMMEHIKDPENVIKEFHRVLKKGGSLVVVTNSKYHPMMFLSSILPLGLRDWLKQRILPSYIGEDTFPTYYKFNSLGRIHRILSGRGFEKRFASYTGAPFFLFNSFLFKLSEIYERVTDLKLLRSLKMHLVVHYVKNGPL